MTQEIAVMEKNMKRLIFVFALSLLGSGASADSEFKVTVDKGSYISVATVTGSSVAGTAFLSANPKLVDFTVFNNTIGAAIFIGTVTATQQNITHTNITNGLPIASSTSFTMNGAMTDTAYFTCQATVASCQVRVLSNLNR